MQKPFFHVLPPEEVREVLRGFHRLPSEHVPMDEAFFRVLAEPIKAAEDLPGFDRSTMDGFAVRSSDTFGASEGSPALLTLVGEIAMGGLSGFALAPGETVRIWTGGALPHQADAVVMVEHAQELDANTVELFKAVAPYENVVRRGEDFKAGEVLLTAGHRMRPQDIGLTASMGITTVRVYRQPVVALISSGDEIVPMDQDPPPGCMRDVNRHTLTAMIREAHGIPLWIGIAQDRLDTVSELLGRGLESADAVIISGGSSMGSRDHVIEAIQAAGDSEILVHGVSISPGKPLIMASVGSRPVVGLPGHPVSAMMTFDQFIVPLLRHIGGEGSAQPFLRPAYRAILSRNCPSREGRTDLVRVRLQKKSHVLMAVPVPAKSGMISSMVRAHGYVSIAPDCEGLYKGAEVTVTVFSPWLEESLEKEYLSGHEASGGGSHDLLGSSRQEKLSQV